MKRNPILILLIVLLVVSLSLVACKSTEYELTVERASITLEKGQTIDLPYQLTTNGELDTETEIAVSLKGDSVTYNAETKKITAVKAGRTTLTITVEGREDVKATLNVNVPEYSIEITGGETATVDLGGKEYLKYTIRKDGVKVSETEKQVIISAKGEAVSYDNVGDIVSFVAEGQGSITVALKDDPSVSATRTYTVVKSFWSSEHQVNKNAMIFNQDGSVSIPGGGQQYYLGVMDGGHKYVFKATIKIPTDLPNNQSIGIGNTLDKNNSSLWFGFQGSDTPGKLRLLIKNFYGGWAGSYDRNFYPDVYSAMTFNTDTFECTMVRDGLDYWYNIGGMIGTFHDESGKVAADADTWVGIYSQERTVTISDYTYSFEDDDIAAAKAECEKPVAFFDVTNKTVNTIVKGDSYTYTASAIYAPNVTDKPAVAWELDIAGVTAGTAQIGAATGTLTVSEDAAGVVKVTAKCGDKEVSFDVTISDESLAKENDVLSVNGGVELNDDGSVVFPETRTNSATLNETEYVDVYYSAKLKAALKGDFQLSFTVTNLAPSSNAQLLVSLGGKGNNLFISNNSAKINGQYVNGSKQLANGVLTANFANAETLEIVIKVVGGHYEVTVNGDKLNFGGDIIRRVEDYVIETPALITVAAGTSCKVSDITLQDEADAEYLILNDNTTAIDNGFESAMIAQRDGKWVGKDFGESLTYFAETLPSGDYTVSMDVKFNVAMTDAKFGIQIGKYEYHICNKISGSEACIQALLFFDNNWGEAKSTAIKNADATIKVKIKRIGNTTYLFVDGQEIGSKEIAANNDGNILYFWTFDNGTAPAGAKVQVTNVTVAQGATIITITGESTLQVGTSGEYRSSVLGSTDTPVWSVITEGTLTAGSADITQEGILTFSADAAGSVTVVVTCGEETANKVVTVSSQPTNQDTALAESVGGVKQDVSNGKIIFDNADINGIASEQAYSEASPYYAILNDANKDRLTIQTDFSIEFTLANYKTSEQYPKFMISLGGTNDQFYVVYFNDGSAQIQTYTSSLDSNGGKYGGQWVNSAMFTGFDASIAHTYKIVCQQGYYKVYLDGSEITGWNMNGGARIIVRNPETMVKPANIMMSTNGTTTCEIFDIKVESELGNPVKTWNNDRVSVNSETGAITLTHEKNSWDNYDPSTKLYTYGSFSDNCTVTFNVKFNEATNDSKLGIKITDQNNSANVVRVITVCASDVIMKSEVRGEWGGCGINVGIDTTLKVTITVVNGMATVTFNDTITLPGNQIATNGVLSFCLMNETDSDVGKTVTISDIDIQDTMAA